MTVASLLSASKSSLGLSPSSLTPVQCAGSVSKSESNMLISFQEFPTRMVYLKHDIEGSQPEWCISSMIQSRHTLFWSETLNI